MNPLFLLRLIAFLGAGVVGAGTMHAVDNGRYNALKVSYAEAEAAAVGKALDQQRKVDQTTLDIALANATAQRDVVTETVTVTKWATQYVKEIVGCPSPELISVFNASATGSAPEAPPPRSPAEPHGNTVSVANGAH